MNVIYAMQDPNLGFDALKAIFHATAPGVLYIDTTERAKRIYTLLYDKPYAHERENYERFMNLNEQIMAVRGQFYSMLDAEKGIEAMRRQDHLDAIHTIVFGHMHPDFIDKKPALVNPDRPKVVLVYDDKVANDDRHPAYRFFLALPKDFLDFTLPMVSERDVRKAQDAFSIWLSTTTGHGINDA